MIAVESYEVGELTENGQSEFSDPATAAQFAALTSELGLAGQVGLIGQTRTIAAFRPLTEAEDFTFRTLFPASVRAERYDREPMPVRVLEILKRAKQSGHFKSYEVWSAEAGSGLKDPVLVGIHSPSNESWRNVFYPLARWGDALDDFSALMKKASAIVRARAVSALRRIQTQVAGDLAAIEAVKPEEAAAVLETTAPNYTSPMRTRTSSLGIASDLPL